MNEKSKNAQTPPKVSVVMPVYSVAATVESAVESVLAQSFVDFELVVVDDCTPDNSIELVETLIAQKKESRVRIVRHQKNRGLAGARNTGIREAQGDYLALLDSDDLYTPDKLAKHVALLDANPEVGVSYSASALMDDDGVSLNLFQSPKLKGISFRDVICRNPIGNGSAPVIRKQVFAEIAYIDETLEHRDQCFFDENFRQSEDIECWIRIAATTDWQFQGIGEPLTWYRANVGGLSANIEAQFASWQRAMDKLADYAPGLAQKYVPLAKAYQWRYLARRAVRSRQRFLGLKLTFKALKTQPKILIEEPKKTSETLVASALLAILPKTWYNALEQKLRG